MSHFTTIKTRITDTEALVEALRDVGFAGVEVFGQPQHLHGYQGDRRKQTAEVVIRREHVGEASNDIGFKRRGDGEYDAIISEFDRSKYNSKWLEKLTHRYAYHLAVHKMTEQGFDLVSEEAQANGAVHLLLRRMA